ncbi:MAG TPA: hypothetical protein VFV87_01715 [Pirellulaceae bacterium]|nr:hypothetical protein [Pirellulaceae bacterium]
MGNKLVLQRWVNYGMVAATVVWIVAIPMWGVLAYRAATTEHYQALYADRKDELFEIALGQALTSGLCCPTVPYAICMGMLALVTLALRPPGEKDNW